MASQLVPEFKLHLITRHHELWNRPVDSNVKSCDPDPFWAIFWPGGQALSRYLIDTGAVKDKRVFDLGTGCGGQVLASILSGAKSIVANDIDKNALDSVIKNLDANDIKSDEVIIDSKNYLDGDVKG